MAAHTPILGKIRPLSQAQIRTAVDGISLFG
jgi:hypothetical protein